MNLSSLQQAERDAIIEALKATHGNKSKAALYLGGISRQTLYNKMKAYDIAPFNATQALERLHEENRDFFEDPEKQALAFIIISRFPDEMALLSPIQRAGVLAGIMALMYEMASAAFKSSNLPNTPANSMTQVFLKDHSVTTENE